MARRLGTLRGPLGRTREPLPNHCSGLTCLQRLGRFRYHSMPSQPGETPGPSRDGRRLFPRRDPSSSKGSVTPGSSSSNQGGREHLVLADAEHSYARRFTGLWLLSKSLVDKGRIMADPKETPFECGDAAVARATAPIIPRRLFSFNGPQYASEPMYGSEGGLRLVLARAPAHSTRHVRTIQACTVEVEEGEKKKGKKRVMSLRAFAVGRFVSSLTPQVGCAGAWCGVGHASHYSRCRVNKGFFCISLTRRRDETVDGNLSHSICNCLFGFSSLLAVLTTAPQLS
ncbi:hypothetical protein V8C42DRAFT_90570 [Trichoderma barbatum]